MNKYFELGQKVKAADRITRNESGDGWRTWMRKGEQFSTSNPKPIEGIFVGWRTYSNGKVIHDYEEGNEYIAKDHVRIALIVENEKRNPIAVFLKDVVAS